MPETYELKRLLEWLTVRLEKYKRNTSVPEELYNFIQGICRTMTEYRKKGRDRLWVWNSLNVEKEAYRKKTAFGVSGKETCISGEELARILNQWNAYVQEGIKRADCRMDGAAPTYFFYWFADFKTEGENILPEQPKRIELPLFPEGTVRAFSHDCMEKKKCRYQHIKNFALYDSKLKMYKVNASLAEAPFEIGRAKAFSPGWLENEALHGKGFVARLSGSTAEFLQIWQMMMFGRTPFSMEKNRLVCRFQPAVPAYLVPEDVKVECTFLGSVPVLYEFGGKRDMIPGKYKVSSILLQRVDGEWETKGDVLTGEAAIQLRDGRIRRIRVITAEN